MIYSGNLCLINYHTDLLKIISFSVIAPFSRNVVDTNILFGRGGKMEQQILLHNIV